MRVFDIITKKKRGGELMTEEIKFVVDGFTHGSIPPEQMSALLMAIWFRGMTSAETVDLTTAMLKSGETVDLSEIPGKKVDKHSTGGVGDKTTLVLAPMVASCGGTVAKMSGRGLGHTGGTIDKLEAIPGFRTEMTMAEFISTVKNHGLAVVGQSAELAPADKKMYALRDVTSTVDSIPLIASSVMSKKLASGVDAIVLDVTMGSGAFMKDIKSAVALADTMVEIGEATGRRTTALITDMDEPLGREVGNASEVREAVEVLNGGGPSDLREVAVALAGEMLYVSGGASIEDCRAMAAQSLDDGSALKKFREMVAAQGGDVSYIDDTSKLPTAKYHVGVVAREDGYLTSVNAEKIGLASMALGAGRAKVGDAIDLAAGITMMKKVGDFVKKGEPYVMLHTNDQTRFKDAQIILQDAFRGGDKAPTSHSKVLARLEKDKLEKLV
ncbi:MAG: pyrimidine-nucleoside phosphorylase [Selenomonadaceae bacterium]